MPEEKDPIDELMGEWVTAREQSSHKEEVDRLKKLFLEIRGRLEPPEKKKAKEEELIDCITTEENRLYEEEKHALNMVQMSLSDLLEEWMHLRERGHSSSATMERISQIKDEIDRHVSSWEKTGEIPCSLDSSMDSLHAERLAWVQSQGYNPRRAQKDNTEELHEKNIVAFIEGNTISAKEDIVFNALWMETLAWVKALNGMRVYEDSIIIYASHSNGAYCRRIDLKVSGVEYRAKPTAFFTLEGIKDQSVAVFLVVRGWKTSPPDISVVIGNRTEVFKTSTEARNYLIHALAPIMKAEKP